MGEVMWIHVKAYGKDYRIHFPVAEIAMFQQSINHGPKATVVTLKSGHIVSLEISPDELQSVINGRSR